MKLQIEKTNIEKIREMAVAFLSVDIKPTKVSFIATHPFTNSWMVYITETNEMISLREENNIIVWRKSLEKAINSSDVESIFYMLHKPYILNFLKFTERYMSDDDLGKILGVFWQSIEQISLDTSISGNDIIRLFKRASKNTLMSEEEREIIKSLPEQVTIYRGVTAYNNKKKNAFSWTTDRSVAEWFAKRFDTGTGEIWTLTVPKERVLCAFSGSEKELIVNLYRYKNIKDISIEKVK